jgi:hypothetical protein
VGGYSHATPRTFISVSTASVYVMRANGVSATDLSFSTSSLS